MITIQKVLDSLRFYETLSLRRPKTRIKRLCLFHPVYLDLYTDRLYIWYTPWFDSGFPTVLPKHLIIIGDKLPESINMSDFDTLVLAPDNTDLFKLFYRFTPKLPDPGIFFDMLFKSNNYQEITKQASVYLQNPISIVDTSFSRLYYTSTVLDLSSETVGSSHKFVLERGIDLILKTDRIKRVKNSSTPVYYAPVKAEGYPTTSPLYAYNFADAAIRSGDTVIGYLTVLGIEKPVFESELSFIENLAKAVSIDLQRSSLLKGRTEEAYELLIKDLIEGKISDRSAFLYKIKKYIKTTFNNYSIVIINKNEHDRSNSISEALIYKLRNEIDDYTSVYYKGSILMLISHQRNDYSFLENLKHFLVRHDLIAGISLQFSDLTDSAQKYREANTALKIGSYYSNSTLLYRYEDYYLNYAIRICTEKAPSSSFCHPMIIDLAESENPADQELLYTLYCYLYCLRDIKKTSIMAGIHNNTMYYRLDRLEERIGAKFYTPEGNLELYFSFCIVISHAGKKMDTEPLSKSELIEAVKTMHDTET